MLDLLGVGFGPSNLALAIAVREQAGGRALDAHFVERQSGFGWHRGMLLDHATMQVSFLKDLVTPRNPTSGFSFVSFLHQTGRFADFTNFKTLYPLRTEFHAYLEWAAEQVSDMVAYDREVAAAHPLRGADGIVGFEVTLADGSTYDTRNIVLGAGQQPCMPAGIRPGRRIWHNAGFLQGLRRLPEEAAPRRFVVVGAGQSAAEVTEFLHGQYPEAQTCAVFSRYGYAPADDSPFANRIFDPEAVDVYFDAPEAVKQQLMNYHRNTNYSVVDRDLIEALYRRSYQERVHGEERLRIMHASRVIGATEDDDGVRVAVLSLTTGEETELEADAVVFATGYTPADPRHLLGEAGSLCLLDSEGRVQIGRDHRISTSEPCRGGIYVHGATEHTHGIGSTLLSNVAVRAGEVIEAVVERRRSPQRFVSLHDAVPAGQS